MSKNGNSSLETLEKGRGISITNMAEDGSPQCWLHLESFSVSWYITKMKSKGTSGRKHLQCRGLLFRVFFKNPLQINNKDIKTQS